MDFIEKLIIIYSIIKIKFAFTVVFMIIQIK